MDNILVLDEQKIKKNIIEIMNILIKNFSIKIIPYYNNSLVNGVRFIGRGLQSLIHPALFSKTLSYFAIQLNGQNNEIVIMEYCKDFTKTEIYKKLDSFSFKSFNVKITKENIFLPINNDAIKITKIDTKNFNHLTDSEKSKKISKIIAMNHYGLSMDDCKKMEISDQFNTIECEINEFIVLKEIYSYFKKNDELSINISDDNGQGFVAEIIKMLKAKRKNEKDKVRMREKSILPNSIISAFWDNEELSLKNTLGRIPIFGFLYDLALN